MKMKTWKTGRLIAGLALFATTFASAALADVKPYQNAVYQAELTRWTIDSDLQEDGKILAGQVEADFAKGSVTVALMREFSCPSQGFCAEVMPEPLVVTLPVVSVKEDQCGAVVTLATNGSERIRMIDYTRSRCQYLVPVSATSIHYSAPTTRGTELVSTMEGEPLRLIKTVATEAGN